VAYGVPAADVLTIAEWRKPASLPHAPEAVLGIVCIHGRMLTVIDLSKLAETSHDDGDPTHILALRGDEQLALAINEPGEVVDYDQGESAPETNRGLVSDVIKHNGTDITILDINELFPTVIQGRERRRRRF
jgi:chemotaxis signal transduction protein